MTQTQQHLSPSFQQEAKGRWRILCQTSLHGSLASCSVLHHDTQLAKLKPCLFRQKVSSCATVIKWVTDRQLLEWLLIAVVYVREKSCPCGLYFQLALLSDVPLLVQINLWPVPQMVPGPDLKADAMGDPSLIKHLFFYGIIRHSKAGKRERFERAWICSSWPQGQSQVNGPTFGTALDCIW